MLGDFEERSRAVVGRKDGFWYAFMRLMGYLGARVTGKKHGAAGSLHTAQRHLYAIDSVLRRALSDWERTATPGAHDQIADASHWPTVEVGAGDAIKHHPAVVGGVAYANDFVSHSLREFGAIPIRWNNRMFLTNSLERHTPKNGVVGNFYQNNEQM